MKVVKKIMVTLFTITGLYCFLMGTIVFGMWINEPSGKLLSAGVMFTMFGAVWTGLTTLIPNDENEKDKI